MTLLIVAIVLLAVSGLPGLFLSRRSSAGQTIAVGLSALGSVLGLAAVVSFLAAGGGVRKVHYHGAPALGDFPLPIDDMLRFGLDDLSALFLLTVFFVPLCGSIYGLGYWPQTEHPQNAPKLRLFYGLLPAGMAALVIARHSILFLFGWEAMALSAYFLVTTDAEDAEVRAAGWIYLVATHTATLTLLGLFGLLRGISGSFQFDATLPADLSPTAATFVFVLALSGFGLKAGIMPLHVWLPGAHATAPSHVSAVMSGVIIKMGVYGFIRTLSLVPHVQAWWGVSLMCLGVASGLLGIAYAVAQHDLKRLLAYSSIENVGVIFIGIGLALVGRAYERHDLAMLGTAGALLHAVNHGLFKSALFFAAGSVIHASHTRRMDLMGGLGKRMPWTALCFLLASTATCALPPTNGFISEFLIYIGLFRSVLGEQGHWAAIAAPGMASIGALAVAAFVGAYGTVFLGVGRSERVAGAREAPRSMVAPMFATCAACLAIGLAPALPAAMLERAANIAAPEAIDRRTSLAASVPFAPLSYLLWILAALLVFGAVMLRRRMTQVEVGRTVTWGCGYSAPTARMQYTASSLGQMLVQLFGWALQPVRRAPGIRDLFPAGAAFRSESCDVVLERAILPGARKASDWMSWFRWVQQGRSQAYLAYVFVILVVLFLIR